jgi:resuscitation-promoting factor RpfA
MEVVVTDRGGRVRRLDRWWWLRVPAVVASLLLVERLLMDEVGTPPTLLRALGDVWAARASPVVSMLVLMALLVEAIAGYALAVLVLRSLCMLPGPLGRVAGRLAPVVTPVVVRRLLDLLVGGTLFAQATLVATPGAPPPRWTAPRTASVAASSISGTVAPATEVDLAMIDPRAARCRWPAEAPEPARARPTPRRSAVPPPPWLGGGPSNTSADHTVEWGDTLWDIAAAHLTPADRSAANVQRYWQQIYQVNRSIIGADPDLILPGTHLEVPRFRRDRR